MSVFSNIYDVIVVGGGHAGAEAAAAAAKLGSKTLLVTLNFETIGQMSCNPAMGGVAKGQIVREIDALGGYSGIVTDHTMIQFRMLNTSKGPAMWSPRAQSDRIAFARAWRLKLEHTDNLDLFADMVTSLLVEGNRVVGVKTQLGIEIKSKSVVLTNGTFLNGTIHIGTKQFGGGRAGEASAFGLTEQLVDLGFESGRMKTGTPPRVDSRSLDFSKMTEQPGDVVPGKFSYLDTPKLVEQLSCFTTYTNPIVHDTLRTGFDESPMYAGRIQGVGPRYCPSIEDKIDRFSTKDRHQIFVEPEGRGTIEMYVNGFSTSLPVDVQMAAMRRMEGFESVKLLRPGYAIEYDYFPPTQLTNTLETKEIKNLFFAGQINGTTGYEEAGGQGLIAGINAHNKVRDLEEFVLSRSEAYIGVLIDDLVTKGTDEPYRMFTSRAEYRTLLRQDNADDRLTPRGFEIGLASKERMDRLEKKQTDVASFVGFLNKTSVKAEEINPIYEAKGTAIVKQSDKLIRAVSRPQVDLKDIFGLTKVEEFLGENDFSDEVLEQAEIKIKYQGYIDKEKANADKLSRLENIRIPHQFDYDKLKSLSFEARQKLNEIRPKTISQASRISGVSPSDISVLLVYMGR
ncbi:MAG: tRNA uridine-5-carboxymethylaminomethyl(34) synthesis enzyme MnmG [Flavobacteriales bacterium]|nr:tRNA uridine-5-carboxymethylaminomethyl(34) synthesis enzyme MnmG [Flavobacteriales bacterium]